MSQELIYAEDAMDLLMVGYHSSLRYWQKKGMLHPIKNIYDARRTMYYKDEVVALKSRSFYGKLR